MHIVVHIFTSTKSGGTGRKEREKMPDQAGILFITSCKMEVAQVSALQEGTRK